MGMATLGWTSYWLLGWGILWGVLLFGGFLLGDRRNPAADRRIPTWARMGSSAALVMAAWSWAAVAWGDPAQPYALWIALGMTLGFVGDLALADQLPDLGVEPVLIGMGAFGLGHVAYIIAMLGWIGGDVELTFHVSAWATWLIIGAAGWFGVVYWGQPQRTMHRLALPYSLLLASTAGIATGMALQDPRFVGLAVGAALFLLSDLILAWGLFRSVKFPFMHDLVWLTYGPGQMLIVYSVMGLVS